jgi:anti-sigma factor RsiW
MKCCDDYSATIQIYLDWELSGQDFDDFPAHLEQCEPCRTELEAAERLSALLHRSRPLYTAPNALCARVMQAAESFNSTTSYAPAHVTRRIAMASAWPVQAAGRGAHKWRALVATILLAAVGLLLLPGMRQRSRADNYIDAAVAAHRSFLNGSLPLEVQSDLPSVVTAWFAGKVPFTLRLPSSADELEHQQLYRLTGGRLVNYKNEYAALIAYQNEAAEDQPSRLFQQVCSGCRRRGGPFRWNTLSLPQASEL